MFEPTVDSLRNYCCPDWFRDAKFGIYLHWGVYSVAEQGEWYPRLMYIEGSVLGLGSDVPLSWEQDDAALRFALPADKPCDYAWAFRLDMPGM